MNNATCLGKVLLILGPVWVVRCTILSQISTLALKFFVSTLIIFYNQRCSRETGLWFSEFWCCCLYCLENSSLLLLSSKCAEEQFWKCVFESCNRKIDCSPSLCGYRYHSEVCMSKIERTMGKSLFMCRIWNLEYFNVLQRCR